MIRTIDEENESPSLCTVISSCHIAFATKAILFVVESDLVHLFSYCSGVYVLDDCQRSSSNSCLKVEAV